MNNKSIIISIYTAKLKKYLYILTAVLAVLVSGLLIVFPIWFFSVNHPSGYSVSVIVIIFLSMIYPLSLKIYKKEISFKSILTFIINIFYYLVFLSGAGAAAVLFMNSLYLQGTAVLAVMFLASGASAYIKKMQEK